VKNRKTLWVTTVAGLLAAVLAACGGSSGGSSAASDSGTNGLKGSPITIEMIVPLSSVTPPTEDYQGAQAAVAAVNASGGINGHPLKVIVCDDKGTDSPTPSITCARNLVSNANVMAEVGDYEAYQEQVNTILAAAKIANVGPPPQSASVLSSSNSFPLLGSEGAGLGTVLADAGATKIQVAYTNIAQAASALQFNQVTLQQGRGLKILGGIPVDLSATDLTPNVQQGTKGDGVALAMEPVQFAQWLTVSRGGNYKQKLSVSGSVLVPQALSALGSKVDGVYVASASPIATGDEAGAVRFRAEMAKYQPKAVIDQVSLLGWMDTWAFAQVARTIKGPVTRASVMTAFSSLNNFDLFGLLPTGFSTTKPFAFPGLSRLFNQQIVEGVVKDGKIVQTSDGYVPIFTKKP
jgi:branched-chain amino acid transport system substrate-binding protein